MTLSAYSPLLGFGDFADLFLETSLALALKWEEGRVDSVSLTEESGAGLRILNGQETRYGHLDLAHPVEGASAEDLARLKKLRDGLVSDLKPASVRGLAPFTPRVHKIIKAPAEVPLSAKIALLERAHRAASETGPHVRQVSINYGEKTKNVGYLNSKGETFTELRIYVVMSVTVTVERNGDLQTGYEALGALKGFELFDGDAVERLARLVGERAHAKLNAPNAPAREMPVILAASAGGTFIHEAIGHSLEADAVLEGSSPAYVGKVGQVVAPEKITVYDDPTVANARGSFHFDDEGTPSERTRLVENGVLRDYLWDRLSARRAGKKSNGHGRRESYAHRPIPRMSNTMIAPGTDDPAAILRSVPTGLLVTRMGGGQVNPANGDFVFDVEEGFLLENGKTKMVRGVTLLGNGPETLRQIDMVGTDHGWGIGTCGKEGQGVPVGDAQPTVRIKKLVVGGQA